MKWEMMIDVVSDLEQELIQTSATVEEISELIASINNTIIDELRGEMANATVDSLQAMQVKANEFQFDLDDKQSEIRAYQEMINGFNAPLNEQDQYRYDANIIKTGINTISSTFDDVEDLIRKRISQSHSIEQDKIYQQAYSTYRQMNHDYELTYSRPDQQTTLKYANQAALIRDEQNINYLQAYDKYVAASELADSGLAKLNASREQFNNLLRLNDSLCDEEATFMLGNIPSLSSKREHTFFTTVNEHPIASNDTKQYTLSELEPVIPKFMPIQDSDESIQTKHEVVSNEDASPIITWNDSL